MAVTLNASTSSGLVQSADTSGVIELQSNGTTALTVNTNEGIQILNCLGVGNATPSTSGAGITFPASQSASSDANTLDDYEEGTWTPSLGATSSNPTVAYTTRAGRYVKIGRTVYANFAILASSVSGGSGQCQILGLPFTSVNTSSGSPLIISYLDNWATNGPTGGYVQQNATTAIFHYYTGATTPGVLNAANYGSTTRVDGLLIYEAA
jgi:hypothetical protein